MAVLSVFLQRKGLGPLGVKKKLTRSGYKMERKTKSLIVLKWNRNMSILMIGEIGVAKN